MNSTHATVSDIMLNIFDSLGVESIFLVPGAQITPLMVALEKHKRIKPILACHELAAGYMAIGYARASGKPGVVFSIGGPGAAYMVGAAITAKADNVPVIFVTGDVPQRYHGLGEFQDAGPEGTNDSAVYNNAIGESQVCSFPEDMSRIKIMIHRCFEAKTPLHVQVPIDVQSEPCKLIEHFSIHQRDQAPVHFNLPLEGIKKVVFMMGYRTLDVIDTHAFSDFVRNNQVGVVTDLKARGLIPESNRECLGFVGFNSDPRALEVFDPGSELSAELTIIVGIEQEIVNQYIPPNLIVINISPENLNSQLESKLSLSEDRPLIEKRAQWLAQLEQYAPKYNSVTNECVEKMSYGCIFHEISQCMPEDTRYCLDAGQIRRAGSMLINCQLPKTLIQSDVLSPMGYGICAAVGIQLACPEAPVISMFGDGSMRMHGLEISTAVKYKLPIIFVLCDNQSYASILSREHMENYASLANSDWSLLAKSIGISCTLVTSSADFRRALQAGLARKEPTLLWLKVTNLLDDELRYTHSLEYKNWLTAINKV
jgi:acetolactate synthase-1/2/3 large subunit